MIAMRAVAAKGSVRMKSISSGNCSAAGPIRHRSQSLSS